MAETKRLREKVAELEAKNEALHHQLTFFATSCGRLEKARVSNEVALQDLELKVLALTEKLVWAGRERYEVRQSSDGCEHGANMRNSSFHGRPLQTGEDTNKEIAGTVSDAARNTVQDAAQGCASLDRGSSSHRSEEGLKEEQFVEDDATLLTYDELRADVQNQPQLSDCDLHEVFQELAVGRNGRISKEEFLAGLEARASAQVVGSVTSLLHSSGVLEVLAKHVHRKVSERLGWSAHAEVDVLALLAEARAEDVRSAWREGEHDAVRCMSVVLEEVRAQRRGAIAAREFNDKYAADSSDLTEAVYKDLADFRAGVEGLLGLPGKDVFGGIAMELCHSGDSRDEFVTSNYGGTRTTPAREFEFVVSSDASTGESYAGGRSVVPLQVYLYATSARRANGEGALYDTALSELDRATRDSVEGVLMRRVKEAGLTTHFVTAAAEHDARLQRLARMSRRELGRAQGEVGRVLNALRGREEVSFEAMVRGMQAAGGVLTREEMAALVGRMRVTLRGARLWEEEVVALRLYTGPLFMKLNAVLREKREGLKGNNYVCTIYAAISGMAKLAEMSPIPEKRIVYRGQRGMRLPECFWKENSQGVRGGVEMAFLSTTTDITVAINYAAGDLPTVLALEVGAVDRGAAVGFLSQFPSEDEILMPPRGFMEVVGEPSIMSTEGGPVLCVPLKLNCNLLCPTLEKLQQSRKTMLVSTLQHVRKEVVRDVDAMVEGRELRERARTDHFWRFKDERGGRRFIESIKEEAGRALVLARQRPAAWYNKDVCFRRAMQQALAVQKKALGKLQLWLEERTLHVARMNALSAEDCDRKAAARLRRLLEEAGEPVAGEEEAAAGERRQGLAVRLCKQMELLEDRVDEVADKAVGETALMAKSAEGAEEAVRLLVTARANVEAARRDGMTALMLAARGGNTGVVTRLARDGADVNRQELRQKRSGGGKGEDVRGFTALMHAAENGHSETVRALIVECGADARVSCMSGVSAVHLAAHNGHLHTLQLLEKEGGADLHADSEDGTAVMLAAQNGHVSVVEWLVKERKVTVDVSRRDRWTPLMMAAANGEERMVLWLLREGAADVHARRDKGWTALYFAALNGHVSVVRALVAEGGADPREKSSTGSTPLTLAAGAGHEEVVRWLVREGGLGVDETNHEGGTALMAAAARGHEGLVRWLVESAGADVAATHKEGSTALMGAAANGQEGAAALLLDLKADVRAATADGWTALMAAALNGHEGVVAVLAGRGADVDARKQNGSTALMAAASKGHAGTVQWLVREGKADAHVKRDNGWDALMCAAARGHVEAVATLVRDAGVDVDATNAGGWTALMSAAAGGHKRVVAELIRAGAKLDLVNGEGQAALMLAETSKTPRTATLLREAGAREHGAQHRVLQGSGVESR